MLNKFILLGNQMHDLNALGLLIKLAPLQNVCCNKLFRFNYVNSTIHS